MRNQYTNLHLSVTTVFGDRLDTIMTTVLAISYVFYPISPIKIIKLLEKASGDQGWDSLTIPREQYYRTIAARVEELAEHCAPERGRHMNAYRRYLHRSAAARFVHETMTILQSIAILGIIASAPFLGTKYSHHALLSHGTIQKLFFAAVIVFLIIPGPIWLLRRAIRRLDATLEVTDLPLSRRILHEFQAVAIDLIRARLERRLDPMLESDRAPTLVEIESMRVLPSSTFDDVIDFLRLHNTSAVGIAGRRGAGKSTLLRWLVYILEPEWVTVYLAAPAVYDVMDFVRVIFSTTASAVIATHQSATFRLRPGPLARVIGTFRPRRPSDEILRISHEALSFIAGSRSDQHTTTAGLSGKGISLQRGRQVSWVERERSHPEWVVAFTQYLENYRRFGGRSVVIAIDELDKLAAADEAIGVINGLKDLFHLPDTHFVVSVSEDALRRFAMRGIPVRDAFDSAFDTIVRVEPPLPQDAWKMLAQRVEGFPMSVALFCYAWSGGLPRDIIRTARACVEIRRRIGRPVTVADLVPPIVRCDVVDAIDAAVTSAIESGSTSCIESLFKLRRQIVDEAFPLEVALSGLDLGDTLVPGDDVKGNMLMLQGLSLYIDIGSAIVRYFVQQADEILSGDSDKVFAIVTDLARARAALAVYPAEATWFLSRAHAGIDGMGAQ
jgi:energy-coupling factor transporter ATP-binding protein EcfA2